MERIDVAVIGAGRERTRRGASDRAARAARRCVLERHPRPGLDTSTHNSGVIHAGLYYPAGSLKARLCVEGRVCSTQFCSDASTCRTSLRQDHRRDDASETHALEELLDRGRRNGVEGLEIVDARFIASARAARPRRRRDLLTRDRNRRRRSATSRRCCEPAKPPASSSCRRLRVVGAEPAQRRHRASDRARDDPRAAGRQRRGSVRRRGVATCSAAKRFTIYPCRGEYAELTPPNASIVNHLVYPVPDPSGHGLGVHLVKTLGGAVWLGPTIQVSGSQGRLRKRSPAGRSVSGAGAANPARDRDCRISDCRDPGSARSFIRRHESFADFLIARDRAILRVDPGVRHRLARADLVAGGRGTRGGDRCDGRSAA